MAARGNRDHGDIEAAEAAYVELLQARPHLVSLELELAGMRLEHGRLDAAVRQLRQRLSFAEIGSDDERLQLEGMLLDALLRLERWADAEPLLRALWTRGEAKPRHLLALARGLESMGEEEQALAVLTQGLLLEAASDDERLQLQLDLARRLRKLGRWSEAIEAMNRAVLLAPEQLPLAIELRELRIEAVIQRGDEALAQEDWLAARKAYRTLLDLRPDDHLALQRLDLLQRLDPATMPPPLDAALEEKSPWRHQALERLGQFSRFLNQLEAGTPTGSGSPAGPPTP
ncbi:tetratricopeptide repeat protein [Synechococcus sp. J7-Johnson]|uniref:tetratricopeptide repeat protein n=1 Tax=Synechococcus sp. J7-Johnson TaxID=2823737 RepID=UPI0020CF6130|nr:tetratricopeptide repeat protein [Synechococcus sp. J7-Johnson]